MHGGGNVSSFERKKQVKPFLQPVETKLVLIKTYKRVLRKLKRFCISLSEPRRGTSWQEFEILRFRMNFKTLKSFIFSISSKNVRKLTKKVNELPSKNEI